MYQTPVPSSLIISIYVSQAALRMTGHTVKLPPLPYSLLFCLWLIASPGINTPISGIPVDPVTLPWHGLLPIQSTPDSGFQIIMQKFQEQDWCLVGHIFAVTNRLCKCLSDLHLLCCRQSVLCLWPSRVHSSGLVDFCSSFPRDSLTED